MEMAIKALENENAVLDKVLEIIDKEQSMWEGKGTYDFRRGIDYACEHIADAVKALAEGEQG